MNSLFFKSEGEWVTGIKARFFKESGISLQLNYYGSDCYLTTKFSEGNTCFFIETTTGEVIELGIYLPPKVEVMNKMWQIMSHMGIVAGNSYHHVFIGAINANLSEKDAKKFVEQLNLAFLDYTHCEFPPIFTMEYSTYSDYYMILYYLESELLNKKNVTGLVSFLHKELLHR